MNWSDLKGLGQLQAKIKAEADAISRDITSAVIGAIRGYQEGFIDLSDLACLCAIDDVDPDRYARLGHLELTGKRDSVTIPSILLAIQAGHLLPLSSRSKRPSPLTDPNQFQSRVVSSADFDKWLAATGQPLPLMMRSGKEEYPTWLKHLCGPVWEQLPESPTTSAARESEPDEPVERMVAWRREIVEHWPLICAGRKKRPSALEVVRWLRKNTNHVILAVNDDNSLTWTNGSIEKPVKFGTVETAISELKTAGKLPFEKKSPP